MNSWRSAFVALFLIACAHDASEPVTVPASAPAEPPELATRAATGPPRCDAHAAGVCGCTEVPVVTNAPNLYFVLDRSGSMSGTTKWTAADDVATDLVGAIGARAWFGAAVFPTGEQCAPGVEVLPLARGGPGTAAALVKATYGSANGGSPTAATLRAAKERLAGSTRRTYVVLVTDGGANCNDTITCGAARCIPNIESLDGCSPSGESCCDDAQGTNDNCLDDDGAVQAVAELHAAGIDTFVVGLTDSGPYATALDAMAKAGGTGAAFKLRDPALATALAKVSGSIVASCTLPLSAPVDPALVEVYVDEQKATRDAWTASDASLTLVGPTCARVLAGAANEVRVVAQCPTPEIR